MNLPKELELQIDWEAFEFSENHLGIIIDVEDGYRAGATRYAEKVAKLEEMLKVAEEALRTIDSFCPPDRISIAPQLAIQTASKLARETQTKLKEMRDKYAKVGS